MKDKRKAKQANTEHLVDGKYSIQDLVDLAQLRSIFEKFTQSTGFTIGFLDHPALNILIATGWRDICTKFHRICPTSLKNCMKSNKKLLSRIKKTWATRYRSMRQQPYRLRNANHHQRKTYREPCYRTAFTEAA